jgi:hypothetical protein
MDAYLPQVSLGALGSKKGFAFPFSFSLQRPGASEHPLRFIKRVPVFLKKRKKKVDGLLFVVMPFYEASALSMRRLRL